jgi:4-amino-4-deoxy-L-arabinose transferase-like glycosyltransferase
MHRSAVLPVLTVAILVGQFWWRGERFIAANGPTFDEAAHLAAGYGYWTAGEFRLNPEHPPLLKLLWALPLRIRGDAPDFPREVAEQTQLNHWHVGMVWLYQSGQPPHELLNPARRVNLALGAGLVVLSGWVAYRVWGRRLAAIAGSGFAACDPTVLALSCVLTTDIGLTVFAFLTCYLLWEYVAAPSSRLLLAAGVSLGLTLGAKFSAVAVVAGLGLAGLLFVSCGGRLGLPSQAERGFRPALKLAIRLGAIAGVLLAATYGVVHFDQWGRGLKFQLTRTHHGDGVAYLLGEISATGWLHYFLVALPVKLPLGLIVAAGVSAVSLVTGLKQDSAHRRALFLVIPPLIFFLLASWSRVNVGVRAVLPVFPFVHLLASGLAASGSCPVFRRGLLTACLVGCGITAWQATPNEIAYFNELIGSPTNGMGYLADSNLDWGQGLPALKHWMDCAGVEAIYLGYFGTDRPEAYGIRYQSLPGYGRVGREGGETISPDTPQKIVAVSANHLLGLFLNDPETYAWLRERTPLAVVGGSIFLFDVSGDPTSLTHLHR